MIVVDASVAVKWFVDEPGHEAAIGVIESGEELLAPDLVIAEVMYVLRRKQRLDLLSRDQVLAAADSIGSIFNRFVPAANVAVMAGSLSQALDHSVYDCFYLACAIVQGCALVTADEVFADKVGSRGYSDIVVKLPMWQPAHAEVHRFPDPLVLDTVLKLNDQFEKTYEGVRQQISRSLSSPRGFQFYSTKDLAPAFGSPSYVRLARFIARLGKSDRARLLALGWLGQGRDDEEWSSILTQAEAYLSDDSSEHLSYLISKISLFKKGIERLRSQGFDPTVSSSQDM